MNYLMENIFQSGLLLSTKMPNLTNLVFLVVFEIRMMVQGFFRELKELQEVYNNNKIYSIY